MANEMAKTKALLRKYALSLPEAHEDFPWGETVVKVGKKVFVFLGMSEGPDAGGVSVKLPISGAIALELPFTEPTGYGLGKSGWVSASFSRGHRVPFDLLRQWVEESYRAVAPKKLVAKLDATSPGAKSGTATPARKNVARATARAPKRRGR